MKTTIKKENNKKLIKEGLIDRFIDSFFDAYKRGIDKQFVNKTKERDPELAKSLEIAVLNIDKAREMLKNKKPLPK